MNTRLEDCIARLQSAETLGDISAFVKSLSDSYDIAHSSYHVLKPDGDAFISTTYEPIWVERYTSKGYEQIDPVVQGALTQFHPLDWNSLDWGSRDREEFWHEAVGAGVGNQGLSIPVRGPSREFGLLTVNHTANASEWDRFLNEISRDFLLLSHYLHENWRTIDGMKHDLEGQKELSPRERDALTLLGSGMNRARIAEKLMISEHTLRVYIESARTKLGAANTVQAVAMALTKGLITP
jgi:DNA-binding CsgD family transcriptional regulator